MTLSEILNIAVPALITTVLIPFIATAISALTEYLKTKANNAKLDKYFEMANDAVITAVAEVMQTFVSEMKKSGQWNEESAKKAFEMAKLRAIEIMGTAALKALPEVVGDVEAWLKSKIEAATLNQKVFQS
jgi:arginine deiminase